MACDVEKVSGRVQRQVFSPGGGGGGGGGEGEEHAAGCVPALPPVVSRITTLHVHSSK